MKEHLVPLSTLPDNCACVVDHVMAGFHAKRRLANLGLVPGIKVVKMRAAPMRGPVEIMLRGSILAIGRGLANKILVKKRDHRHGR